MDFLEIQGPQESPVSMSVMLLQVFHHLHVIDQFTKVLSFIQPYRG